jgi:hypothetical protein
MCEKIAVSVIAPDRGSSDAIASPGSSSQTRRARSAAATFSRPRVLASLSLVLSATVLFTLGSCVSFSWNALLLRKQLELHLNDLGKFYYDARAFAEGRPMYEPSPATDIPLSESTSKQLLNLNPPHMHLVLLPFVSLVPQTMLVLWLLSGLGCLVAVVYKSLQAAGSTVRLRRLLWYGLAVTLSAAFGSIMLTGQITMHMLPLIMWAWLAARRLRWNQVAIALGLGISIKPFLLIFVPWLAIRGRVSAACLSLIVCSLCFAVGVAVFGVDNHAAWLAAIGAIDWHYMPLNASLQAFLGRALQETFYFEPVVDMPQARFMLWFGGSTLIGLASLSVAILDRSPEAADRTFCILLLAALLMCPLGWVYYLLLALPSAIGLLSRGNHGHRSDFSIRKRGRTTCLVALASGCALIFVPTVFVMSGQPSGLLTISLGSAHFWAVFLCWVATCLDGLISLNGQGLRLWDVMRVGSAPAKRLPAFS